MADAPEGATASEVDLVTIAQQGTDACTEGRLQAGEVTEWAQVGTYATLAFGMVLLLVAVAILVVLVVRR